MCGHSQSKYNIVFQIIQLCACYLESGVWKEDADRKQRWWWWWKSNYTYNRRMGDFAISVGYVVPSIANERRESMTNGQIVVQKQKHLNE